MERSFGGLCVARSTPRIGFEPAFAPGLVPIAFRSIEVRASLIAPDPFLGFFTTFTSFTTSSAMSFRAGSRYFRSRKFAAAKAHRLI
jgi:hypothetical protein